MLSDTTCEKVFAHIVSLNIENTNELSLYCVCHPERFSVIRMFRKLKLTHQSTLSHASIPEELEVCSPETERLKLKYSIGKNENIKKLNRFSLIQHDLFLFHQRILAFSCSFSMAMILSNFSRR